DELVDARQRAANDVAHLVAHGVGVALQRPLDADLVLPSRRSIVRVEDDTDASAVAALSSQSTQGFTLGVGAATLRWLGSERFAPATKYHRCVCPGLWLARDSAVAALGWSLASIKLSTWMSLPNDAAKLQFVRNLIS
ncbi:hypothetical protein HaLaN_08074, partial [Haematococcus lacustris]